MAVVSTLRFTCNICGASNEYRGGELTREDSTCASCESNLRLRGLVHALSIELFGVSLPLTHFPRVKSLRGIGLSDSSTYAGRLAEKLDYRNTFVDRPPLLDITQPPETDLGAYDFIVAADVLEHVPPPVERSFENLFRLLKPSGVLLITAPYSLEASTLEHFPELHEFGFGKVGGKTVLLNRTREGQLHVHDNLVFHGGVGSTLEMREFTGQDLLGRLTAAGFSDVRIVSEDYAPFGIVWSSAWSLPIVARKGPASLGAEATRDIMEEWRDLNRKFHGEMQRLNRSFWFRALRKLGLI